MESGQQSIHDYLIRRSQAADRQAQNELYKLYAKAMYNTCRRILGDEDDARDALQEAFISAFGKLHTLQDTGMFTAWLKRIVVNQCLNTLKKKREYVVELKDSFDRAEENDEEMLDYRRYATERIMKAIDQLPDGARTILNLYVFEGYDHKEIGQILEITESASKAQFSKAKSKIRNLLNLTIA